jgi:hypothetical protein
MDKPEVAPGKGLIRKLIITVVLLCICSVSAIAYQTERRRDQFEDSQGYLILPVPYSYPGIGEGIMLIGYMGNILKSPVDAYFIGFSGEAEGYYAMVNDLFLIPEKLYLNINQMDISKYGINMYSKRGMDTDKDDYSIYIGNKFLRKQGRLVFSLFEKRWEIWAEMVSFEGRTNEIRDAEGGLINEYEDPLTFDGERSGFGTQLDFTDDKADPRSGLRFKSSLGLHPAKNKKDADFNVLTWGLTLYLPILQSSTWAFHFSRSDAVVISKGETDYEELKEEKGFSMCRFASDQEICEYAIIADVEATINANSNGTSMSLGGPDRLRSYPTDRFSGAHTLFYGSEFRWNISTEKMDIDLYFLKDILQALQIAFYWEQGSVSESAADLGEQVRSSAGLGLRLVAKSGNAYRLDWATGEEGPQYTILFQYPWGESE